MVFTTVKNSYNSATTESYPLFKRAGDLNRQFYEEDTHGRQAHEKTFNIPNYQRRANENHEMLPDTLSVAIIKKIRNNKC